MNEREIFQGALDYTDTAQRQAYLDRACGNNASLRARIEALLRSHDSASQFLNIPAAEQLNPSASPSPRTVGLSQCGEADAGSDDNPEDESLAAPDLSFLTPSAKPGSLGTLGHYDILQLLGQGAFGLVFKAFDQKLHRQVAIKVMNPRLAATSPPRKRFLREARSAAAIKHENIVQVYSVEEQPLPYLVMECVDGKTLKEKMDSSGPLEVAEILHLGRQIAAGLAAAHAQGLIHRDIKPGNILIEAGAEQKVKITDFGLARAADDATMTRTGVISGTPMFMAPEQAQGLALDHRVDLFSLGSVLYQMACGRPPFRGATAIAVLKRVTDEPSRPIQEILAEVPDWLCAIIAKLHAKKPEDRFQSAKEVADLLARCQASLQQHGQVELPDDLKPFMPKPPSATKPDAQVKEATPNRPAVVQENRGPRRRRWAAAAAALLVLFVGLTMTEATGVTNLRGTIIRLFSPDGTLVVEVDDPGVSVMIDGEEMVITGTGAKEIRLKPGQYKVLASRDGKVVRQELVAVTKNGRQVVRVSKEAAPIVAVSDGPKSEPSLSPRFTNSLGMEFALIPKGKAWLGGGGGKAGDKEVEFKDFYLGVFEVTQEEWEKVMGNNPSRFSREGAMKDAVKDISDADLKRFPVEMVSWSDAQRFVEELNRRTKETGWVYRLPKEAEWEYACRGGPLSNKVDFGFDYYLEKPALELLPDQANLGHPEGLQRTCKVGSYKPNRLGLYDMHGNVWELCDDLSDPKQTASAVILRGGSWLPGYKVTAANRSAAPGPAVTARASHIGLRVARVRVADPDRRAAEWVLSVGGTVRVNDENRDITAVADLPKDAFTLTGVILSENKAVTDTGLACFQDCKNLKYLQLRIVPVTDAGLVHFKNCKNLTYLELGRTSVTDAGLADFKDCKHLEGIWLWSTAVTDAGLVNFKDCKNLTNLNLSNTAVTDAGMEYFKGLQSLKSLILGGTKVTDAGLAHFKDCKNLIELGISGPAVTDVGLAYFKDCKNLIQLGLDATQVSDKSLETLAGFSNLTLLRVGKTKLSANGVKTLATALSRCRIEWDGGVIEPTATTNPDRRAAEWVLSIGGALRILANGVESIIAKDGKLPAGPFHVTRIDLQETRIADADLVNLKQLANLRSLNIGHFFGNKNLTDAGLEHLLALPQLEELIATGANITDIGVERLTSLKTLQVLYLPRTLVTNDGLRHLQKFPALRSVGVSFTPISDAGLSHLSNLTNLELLNLEATPVTDDGLKHLQNLKKLDSLNLPSTKIRGAGLVHLKGLSQLRTLNLDSSTVTDAGLEHVKDLKGLTRLKLLKTKVTAAGVKKLASALPNCRIDWDGGVNGPVQPAVSQKIPPSAALLALRREQIPPASLANAGDGDPKKAPPSLVAVLGEPEPIHTSAVNCLAFSPDGRWLASGSDRTVHLHEAATGQFVRLHGGHQARMTCVAFAADSKTLVTADIDGTVQLWSMAEERAPTTLQLKMKNMRMAVSRDGRFLAAGGTDGKVKLWKWGQWESPVDLPVVSTGSLASLTFSSDGELLACVWQETKAESPVGLYRTSNATHQRTLPGAKSCNSLSFIADGKYLATAGPGSRAIWNLATGKAASLDKNALQVCFSPAANHLAIHAHSDSHLHVYDVDAGSYVKGTDSIGFAGMIWSMAFSPDGKKLALGDHQGAVNIYNTADWRLDQKTVERGHRNGNVAVAVSPDGRTLLSSGLDNTLRRWDLATPNKSQVFHQNNSPFLVYSPDGKMFATGGPTLPVTLWDSATTKETAALPIKLTQLVFSPDSRTIAGQGTFFDPMVHLWDVQLGKEVHRFQFEGSATGLTFSADGRLLAAASNHGNKVNVWNVVTGEEVASLKCMGVRSTGFHPDGTLLATGHRDGTITIWDTATWKSQRTLRAHTGPVLSLRFTSDGKSLLSSGTDGVIQVRSPEHERAQAMIPVGPANLPVAFDLDASGQYLFATGPTPLIYVHRLPLE